MRRFKSHARRQLGPNAVKMKIGISAGIRTYAGRFGNSHREVQFDAGLLDRDRPLTADVLIEIFEIVVDGELMFGRIAEVNDMPTARESAGFSRNSDVKYTSIFVAVKHSLISVNFGADRLKRTRFHPLRINRFNPQPSMKAAIKDACVVNNLKSFRHVHRAISVYRDLAIKRQDSIGSLGAGESAADDRAADEPLRDEIQLARFHLGKA